MNVLSLFDGISCGKVALERIGIKIDSYYSSEIDKHAITVSKDNHPDIIRLGDVTKWRDWSIDWKSIDLLIGGSPCQDFSSAKVLGISGEPTGLQGDRSSLFYEYLSILKHIQYKNPKVKFLLENTKMKKDSESQLNNYMGVDGVHINSSLVSFQTRPRIYWTNISKPTQPKDKNINFQDFKDTDFAYCDKHKVKPTPSRLRMWSNGEGNGGIGSCLNVTNREKIRCLTTKQDRCPNSGLVAHGDFCRYLTRNEMELGQTLPKGYTNSVSYNQACKALGNGWTVDIIAHLLKPLSL